jgi:hypothetical protein
MLRWGAYDAHGVTLDMDYVIVPVPKPPACLVTPVVDEAGHRWVRRGGGVMGMCAVHVQVCDLCAASRTALTPPGWDGGALTWVYPDGHPAVCPGAGR